MTPFSSAGDVDVSHLRIAIVHYWLVRRRGGERVLEVLAEMFPQADIYTLVLDRSTLAPSLSHRRIVTSFLQKFPGVKRHYKKLMALFPLALEQFDLDGYDLVLSHEAGPSKGVLTSSQTCHICYVHSPMRYVWDMYHDYKATASPGFIGRGIYALVAHYLRLWDHASSARVDYFAASSANSARRIGKHYRRHSEVIYPPVDLTEFSPADSNEDFYLVVSQLVGYKRVDLAIKACNELSRNLVVIGDGELAEDLRRIAGPTVIFVGRQPDAVVRDHYRRCRAFLFPGEEDIGLTPIEAQASGRPVIAFARGGALETVKGVYEGEPFRGGATGIFFSEQTVDSIVNAMRRFEESEHEFVAAKVRQNAELFDIRHFKERMMRFIDQSLMEFHSRAVVKDGSRQHDFKGVGTNAEGAM